MYKKMQSLEYYAESKSLAWSSVRSQTRQYIKQEAQLALRNRASAMHFFVAKLFSIAVMTYSYLYHLPNLRPAIFYAHSVRPQAHVRMTRDPTVA